MNATKIKLLIMLVLCCGTIYLSCGGGGGSGGGTNGGSSTPPASTPAIGINFGGGIAGSANYRNEGFISPAVGSSVSTTYRNEIR
jgi:hypothetical protein